MSHSLIASAVSLYPLYKVLRQDVKELLGVTDKPHPEVPRGTSPSPRPPRPSPPPRPKPAFREDHPHGVIHVECWHLDEGTMCIYRATIVDSLGNTAAAFGYCSGLDNPRYIELAEQRAIAAAKKSLGYDH